MGAKTEGGPVYSDDPYWGILQPWWRTGTAQMLDCHVLDAGDGAITSFWPLGACHMAISSGNFFTLHVASLSSWGQVQHLIEMLSKFPYFKVVIETLFLNYLKCCGYGCTWNFWGRGVCPCFSCFATCKDLVTCDITWSILYSCISRY